MIFCVPWIIPEERCSGSACLEFSFVYQTMQDPICSVATWRGHTILSTYVITSSVTFIWKSGPKFILLGILEACHERMKIICNLHDDNLSVFSKWSHPNCSRWNWNPPDYSSDYLCVIIMINLKPFSQRVPLDLIYITETPSILAQSQANVTWLELILWKYSLAGILKPFDMAWKFPVIRTEC